MYKFPGLNENPEALVKSAESLNTLHHNIRIDPSTMSLSWSALSSALTSLTTASKLPDVENLSAVHILRGDVELLRYQMGQGENGWDVSKKNESALLKNAEVFYRGGKNVAKAAGEQSVEREGGVKELLVKGLRGEGVEGLRGIGENEVAKVIGEMVEDGLVSRGQLEGMGLTF
jgi:hypothetical protein